MTAITQSRMNVMLALAIPAFGLAYLTFGFSLATNPAIGAVVAFGVLWLTVAVALNTVRGPRAVGSRVTEVAQNLVPRRPATSAGVVDVGRPSTRQRWPSLLLVPLELLALAWSVPFVILLIMVPIGLAVASVVWVGRRLFAL